MAEPVYTPETAKVLDEIETDPARADLRDAICDAIDLICDHPGSAGARRNALGDLTGRLLWAVSARTRTEDWLVLWHPVDDEVLIAHLGPAAFRR